MQNKETNTVCTLCLKPSDRNSIVVGTGIREMLICLGLKLELDITENCVICRNCSENLQKCFEFKTTCTNTENCIISARDKKNGATKLDMREIYLSKNENENDAAVPKEHNVCRLCVTIKEIVYCTTLGDKERAILRTYFPKIDLDVIDTPTICTSCYSSLHNYASFMQNYLDVQDKTENYCDVDSKNQGESILLFLLTYKGGPTKYGENRLYNKSERESLLKIETQEMHIKHEVDEPEKGDESEVDKLNSSPQFTTRNVLCPDTDTTAVKNEGYLKTELKHDNMIDTERDELNIKYEETYIKIKDSDNVRLRGRGLSSQSELTKQLTSKETSRAMYTCEICPYTTYYNHRLIRHHLIHQNTSEVTLYQCNTCTFKTIHKYVLKTHLLLHKDAPEYQCEECSYKTKFKRYLTKHRQIHKNASLMYSCHLCAYKATQKCYLKQHMGVHKNASEITLYLCEMCKYKTKDKNNLKRHLLIHKDAPEHQCEECSYKTKFKRYMTKHKQIHKSAALMYSCALCAYKTTQKRYLKQHMGIHKNASEITLYLCEMCKYKTKDRNSLKRHLLIHKDSSEVIMYKCDFCTFETRHKNASKCHLLHHRDISEITIYSCEMCPYKTKQKANLNRHVLIHKNASEIGACYCENCTSEINQEKHTVLHKGASESEFHQCEECDYKTKCKVDLSKHVITHKNAAQTYCCALCTYKAKQKGNLRRHMLVHKHSAEAALYQ